MNPQTLCNTLSDPSLAREAASEARVMAVQAQEEARAMRASLDKQVIVDVARTKGIEVGSASAPQQR